MTAVTSHCAQALSATHHVSAASHILVVIAPPRSQSSTLEIVRNIFCDLYEQAPGPEAQAKPGPSVTVMVCTCMHWSTLLEYDINMHFRLVRKSRPPES